MIKRTPMAINTMAITSTPVVVLIRAPK